MANVQEIVRAELAKSHDLTLLALTEAAITSGKKDLKKVKVYPVALARSAKQNVLCLVVLRQPSYTLKYNFDLSKMTSVVLDARPNDEEELEFVVILDNRPYRIQSLTYKSKQEFIAAFVQYGRSYIKEAGAFEVLNMDQAVIHSAISSLSLSIEDRASMKSSTSANIPELSAREQAVLERIIGSNREAIEDGHAFTKQLTKELDTLSKANAVSIIQMDKNQKELHVMLAAMLEEIRNTRAFLKTIFYEQLDDISSDIARLAKRDRLLAIQSTNYQRLQKDLHTLLEVLDTGAIEESYGVLEEGKSNLDNPEDREKCLAAAKKISDATNLSLQSGLSSLSAVSSTIQIVRHKENNFSNRLQRKLTEIIERQGNSAELSDPTGLTLRSHKYMHGELMGYKDLVLWLKSAQWPAFQWLAQFYRDQLSKCYKKELHILQDRVASQLGKAQKSNTTTSLTVPQEQSLSSASELIGSASMMAFPVETSTKKVSQVFDDVLGQLMWFFGEERHFTEAFFHVDQVSKQAEREFDGGNVMASRGKFTVKNHREMLDKMFAQLPALVDRIIEWSIKIDPINVVVLFIVLDKYIAKNVEDGKMILTSTFASRQIMLKRRMNDLVAEQSREGEITEGAAGAGRMARLRNKLVGTGPGAGDHNADTNVLAVTKNLPLFIERVERILDGQRNVEVDKAVLRLAQNVFATVERCAQLHPSPSLVMLENFHYLQHELSLLKLPQLEAYRKEAQAKYKTYCQIYVQQSLVSPMGRLGQFMDGIQSAIESGVKESEISFQLQFSRLNLKRLLQLYSGREIKKGLQVVYKKLEKDLGPKSSMLQVVWRYMQDELLAQYALYESLIARCYPNSGLKLEFTVNDLVSYFSDVAVR